MKPSVIFLVGFPFVASVGATSWLHFNGDVNGSVVTIPDSPSLGGKFSTTPFTIELDFRWNGSFGYRSLFSQPYFDDTTNGVQSGVALALSDGVLSWFLWTPTGWRSTAGTVMVVPRI